MHDTVYVQNKSLHQNLKNITPKEFFTGMKLKIEHFRLFGCPVCFHVPKENNFKLDPLERKDTSNLQIHSKSTSLVKENMETSRDDVLEEEIVFQRSREPQMEINIKIMPSPPSAVQRETDIILVDPVALVDMFKRYFSRA
jgi:hypothetical protein